MNGIFSKVDPGFAILDVDEGILTLVFQNEQKKEDFKNGKYKYNGCIANCPGKRFEVHGADGFVIIGNVFHKADEASSKRSKADYLRWYLGTVETDEDKILELGKGTENDEDPEEDAIPYDAAYDANDMTFEDICDVFETPYGEKKNMLVWQDPALEDLVLHLDYWD